MSSATLNSWEALLKPREDNSTPKTTVIVVGASNKTIDSFCERAFPASTNDYDTTGPCLLPYSYSTLPDFGGHGVARKVDLWRVADQSVVSLLPSAMGLASKEDQSNQTPATLNESDEKRISDDETIAHRAYKLLDTLMIVVVSDFHEPLHNLIESVKSGLRTAQKISEILGSQVPLEKRDDLCVKISRHVQTFGVTDAKQRAQMTVDTSIPKNNLGVHLSLVILGTEQFRRQLPPSDTQVYDKFEFCQRRIRQACLPYGCALLMGSTRGTDRLAGILRGYVESACCGGSLQHKPTVLQDSDEQNDIAFLPSGYDSQELIKAVLGKRDDSVAFSDVFPPMLTRPSPVKRNERVVPSSKDFLLQAEWEMKGRTPMAAQLTSPTSNRSTSLRSPAATVSNMPSTPFTPSPLSPTPATEEVLSPMDSQRKKKKKKKKKQSAVEAFFKTLSQNNDDSAFRSPTK